MSVIPGCRAQVWVWGVFGRPDLSEVTKSLNAIPWALGHGWLTRG